MGKKKKFKKDLFDKDYSDISLEEQLKMSLLADKIMAGEVVGMGFDKEESHEVDTEESLDVFLGKIIAPVVEKKKSVPNLSELLIDDSYSDSELEMYMDQIIENCEVVRSEPIKIAVHEETTEEEPVKMKAPTEFPKHSSSIILDDSDDDEDDVDDEDIDENVDGDDDVEPTLDNQFKVIQADHSNGDIVIRDSWEDFKSHTISFYNMIEAKMDYSKSPLYEQMKGFVDLAVAFIAGPVLIIKQGNKKFKEFINSVDEFDRERIFVLSKMDDTVVDENGDPALHFLMYYIDQESKNELESLFDTFENSDDDNEIILDFIYSVFKKAVDRHENPWGCYDGIDTLIDEYESSDADIDFVIDLIKKDKDTVLGESNIDKFLEKHVLPIEMFISDRYDSANVFNVYVSLLGYVLDNTREDIEIVDDVIQVPTNFGFDENGTRRSSFIEAREVYSEQSSGDDDLESDDEFEIEDTDGDDIDLLSGVTDITIKDSRDNGSGLIVTDSSVSIIEETKSEEVKSEPPKKKLGTPVATGQGGTGIKKFGSTPHSGGPMIITK